MMFGFLPAMPSAWIKPIARDEIRILEQALPMVEADSRLGFHAECQGYMYTPELMGKKLAALRKDMETL